MATSPFKLWADLTRRGFRIRVVAGRPAVRPDSKIAAEERQALAQWGGELAALMSSAEPWDANEVHRLGYEADTLVADLGVSGRHPEVREATEVVFATFATRNMQLVREAHAKFVLVVRRIAAQQSARPVQGDGGTFPVW